MAGRDLNRKLLVSVFNAQEAREAVLGGARIVDSEDPRSALGNIKPRHIMAISDAVLDFKRDYEVQLSTNIGEDQLLFRRAETGEAIEKSPYEIAGKAAQAAIGVSASMGTRVHDCNIVKVGLDGMPIAKLKEVLTEVVLTLDRTECYCHAQVMSVLFVQDIALWDERRRNDPVRRVLVELREFHRASTETALGFDLTKDGYAVNTLRDQNGVVLFTDQSQVSLASLIRKGVLPPGSEHAIVEVNDLFPHATFYPGMVQGPRTTQAVIQAMVDATADCGAHGIMLDTSILMKVSNVCLVDTRNSTMVDFNPFYSSGGLQRCGILPLTDIRFFVDYCHYRGVSANVAGSLDSYQAQMLWALIPELDQLSTRGSASAVAVDPVNPDKQGVDSRQHRIIRRSLVRGLAPPEHGGVLNIPDRFKNDRKAMDAVGQMRDLMDEGRRSQGLGPIDIYFVDQFGNQASLN